MDHERVAPHGLRLLAALLQLLSATSMEQPADCPHAPYASWLSDAQRVITSGLQSASMKVSPCAGTKFGLEVETIWSSALEGVEDHSRQELLQP